MVNIISYSSGNKSFDLIREIIFVCISNWKQWIKASIAILCIFIENLLKKISLELNLRIWYKEYFHGKFGAIKRLNLLRALTPLLCQSHRNKCFWNFMSSLYIVLFCKFYVTIWCKDNKLIIYLSIYIVLFCNFYVTIWCKDNKLIIYLSTP